MSLALQDWGEHVGVDAVETWGWFVEIGNLYDEVYWEASGVFERELGVEKYFLWGGERAMEDRMLVD